MTGLVVLWTPCFLFAHVKVFKWNNNSCWCRQALRNGPDKKSHEPNNLISLINFQCIRMHQNELFTSGWAGLALPARKDRSWQFGERNRSCHWLVGHSPSYSQTSSWSFNRTLQDTPQQKHAHIQAAWLNFSDGNDINKMTSVSMLGFSSMCVKRSGTKSRFLEG